MPLDRRKLWRRLVLANRIFGIVAFVVWFAVIAESLKNVGKGPYMP